MKETLMMQFEDCVLRVFESKNDISIVALDGRTFLARTSEVDFSEIATYDDMCYHLEHSKYWKPRNEDTAYNILFKLDTMIADKVYSEEEREELRQLKALRDSNIWTKEEVLEYLSDLEEITPIRFEVFKFDDCPEVFIKMIEHDDEVPYIFVAFDEDHFKEYGLVNGNEDRDTIIKVMSVRYAPYKKKPNGKYRYVDENGIESYTLNTKDLERLL